MQIIIHEFFGRLFQLSAISFFTKRMPPQSGTQIYGAGVFVVSAVILLSVVATIPITIIFSHNGSLNHANTYNCLAPIKAVPTNPIETPNALIFFQNGGV
jgi:hypothetical protein